jgi:NADH-ubiquinone oxidoreductase chain 1
MISYEVALAFLVIFYSLFLRSYSLTRFNEIRLLFIFYPVGILWFIICLRESQRTPFDLAEGESELVSGFNTEFRASYFALLFLGEYMSILLMCMLSTLLVFRFMLKSVEFILVLSVFFTLFI